MSSAMVGVLATQAATLNSFDHLQAAQDYARLVKHGAKVSWNMRGAWLLQEANQICDPQLDPHCGSERTKVLILLISLSVTIIIVGCMFNFFREDREEQLTPLCPQMIVQKEDLKFRFPKLPLSTQAASGGDAHSLDVLDSEGKVYCKISMDWPDPFRGSPHGVAATVRLTQKENTLATIVARNVAVMGQGLALCRTGCEIFGFVEPAEGNRYYVRHRTGVHLLTLIGGGLPGNADDWDIEGYNPAGSKVCVLKKNPDDGNECVGKVLQHVDAGLVLCALMAIYVHRRLSMPVTAAPRALSPPPPGAELAPGGEEAKDPPGGEDTRVQGITVADMRSPQTSPAHGNRETVAETGASTEDTDADIESGKQ